MKVKFDFSIDDIVNVSERTLDRSKVVRSWRSQGMAAIAFIGGALAYSGSSGTHEQRLLAAAVAAVFCAAIYPFIAGRERAKKLRKVFREQFGGDGPFTCEVELLPEGVVASQAGSRSQRSWSTVTAIEDTADSVDFYTRGSGTLVVRNRAFRSAEERRQFLELARKYAGSAGS